MTTTWGEGDTVSKPAVRLFRSDEDANIYWVFKADSAAEALGYVEKYVTDAGVHWSPFRPEGQGLRRRWVYIGRNFKLRREAAEALL